MKARMKALFALFAEAPPMSGSILHKIVISLDSTTSV